METYMSGLFALFGALVGSFASIVVQIFVQGREDSRALNKIAYESAIAHWKTLLGSGIENREGLFTLLVRYHVLIAAGACSPRRRSGEMLTTSLASVEAQIRLATRPRGEERTNDGDAATNDQTGQGENS